MKHLITLSLLVFLGTACSNAQVGSENFKDVNPSEAKAMMAEQQDLQIIDVRTDGECAAGMIEGAVQMDINKPDFQKRLAELDKEKPVLVYCKSGGRSSRAQGVMKAQGFTVVYNLSGGYTGWK